MFRLGALFKLSGMEFQNKAPLYLKEFLPTSRLKRGTSNYNAINNFLLYMELIDSHPAIVIASWLLISDSL